MPSCETVAKGSISGLGNSAATPRSDAGVQHDFFIVSIPEVDPIKRTNWKKTALLNRSPGSE
jgi:hypothetical protein